MKRNFKSIAGVTLLEIMLVLAIAAMIVVMSVKYYQTATAQEQINTSMDEIQAIAVAADNMEQATGSYSGVGTNSGFTSLLPSKALITPWGAKITVSGSASSYTVSFATMPSSTCPSFSTRLQANSHYSVSSCSTSPVVVTYNANT